MPIFFTKKSCNRGGGTTPPPQMPLTVSIIDTVDTVDSVDTIDTVNTYKGLRPMSMKIYLWCIIIQSVPNFP